MNVTLWQVHNKQERMSQIKIASKTSKEYNSNFTKELFGVILYITFQCNPNDNEILETSLTANPFLESQVFFPSIIANKELILEKRMNMSRKTFSKHQENKNCIPHTNCSNYP